jgi:hypothetical protein
MALLRNRHCSPIPVLVFLIVLVIPLGASAQQYKLFTSKEFGFSMKYPANWIKLDKPKGNYYVVFQAPDLMDNFRNRIHVACHSPVKDKLKVFLQEFRNGIKDLQKKTGTGRRPKTEEVRIIDEGEFKSDVPGAYYFFIQALDDKLKIWMDIVIVFYKHEQTLLRVSCLAPSKGMEKMQPTYNDVLVSLKFASASAPPAAPAGPAATRTPPQPTTVTPTPAPAPSGPAVRTTQPTRMAPPPSGPRPRPRGPVGPIEE